MVEHLSAERPAARPLQARARRALAVRLRELLPADALAPGGEHALRFADALVPSLSSDDVAWAHAQLASRATGELRPARAGTVNAHAAGSSTALVCSAFAPWRHRVDAFELLGLGPFSALRLEERLHIPHGGGTPNLDVALETADGFVGVESKLTEHLAVQRPRPWRPAYHRPAMRDALQGGWAATFAVLLEGSWQPRHLDAGQLVRHALSLRGSGEVVLLWWEPANGPEHPEVRAHRAEVAELLARVGDAPPRLHATTWAAVLDAWEPRAPEHVAALRARYDVAVPLGSSR